jgi:hypothetical protein
MSHRQRQPGGLTACRLRVGAGTILLLILVTWAAILAAATTAAADDFELVVTPRAADATTPPLQRQPQAIQLMLDDSSSENDIGLVAANGAARQFMWCNQFTPAAYPLELEQIWVLFPPGNNMAEGNAVQLLVYLDPDSTPGNGAGLVASYDETIQAVDGTTFSVYDIAPPLAIDDAGDVLICVINRFVTSGITSTTQPATIDTTSSQGRSWIGVWTGDPPASPSLPADGLFDLVDRFEPGNWMIRGFGTAQVQPPQPQREIPVLGPAGLGTLIVLLILAGIMVVVRRH